MEVDAYLKQWRRTAVNRVCEAFELVETEIERLGEKSDFYRKFHELPPAESDQRSQHAGRKAWHGSPVWPAETLAGSGSLCGVRLGQR